MNFDVGGVLLEPVPLEQGPPPRRLAAVPALGEVLPDGRGGSAARRAAPRVFAGVHVHLRCTGGLGAAWLRTLWKARLRLY